MTLSPNWVSPPGATIARLMAVRELQNDELADALSISRDDVLELLDGHMRIEEELAAALSNVIGSSARFWIERDKRYLEEVERINGEKKEDHLEWAKSMPLKSLRDFGILAKGSRAESVVPDVLAFFGCRNLADWNAKYQSGVMAVAYRTSLAFVADDMATLVWRRMGERQVEQMKLPKYDEEAFEEVLDHIKGISAFKSPKAILQRLRARLSPVGVAITTARAPKGCRASGATWWTDDGNPVIHLSFRHLSSDHFWFTFYHECAHVILHRGEFVDFDQENGRGQFVDSKEREANEFAEKALVPSEAWDALEKVRLSPKNIISIAKEINIAPGILVGQLQHKAMLPRERLNSLKHRYRWAQDPYEPELVTS